MTKSSLVAGNNGISQRILTQASLHGGAMAARTASTSTWKCTRSGSPSRQAHMTQPASDGTCTIRLHRRARRHSRRDRGRVRAILARVGMAASFPHIRLTATRWRMGCEPCRPPAEGTTAALVRKALSEVARPRDGDGDGDVDSGKARECVRRAVACMHSAGYGK